MIFLTVVQIKGPPPPITGNIYSAESKVKFPHFCGLDYNLELVASYIQLL
jgi:hypothetical protein